MQEYRIGDFARHMCVSADALKHYERYGLIQFRRDDANGYRYCEFNQCFNLLSVMGSRTADVPLRSNKDYVDIGESAHALSNGLRQTCNHLEQKIRLYEYSMRYVRDCLAILEAPARTVGASGWRSTGRIDGFHFFPFATGERFIQKTRPQSEQFATWCEHLPVVRPAVRLRPDKDEEPLFGLFAPAAFVEDDELPHTYAPKVEGRFLTCDLIVYSKGAADRNSSPFTYDEATTPVVEFAREHNVAYDALYAEHMFITNDGSGVLRYDRIHLQLRQEPRA